MYPFDLSGIVTRLRLDLEHLFQANNQLIFLGRSWPTAEWLCLQAENRLNYCITDLSAVILELGKWPAQDQYCGFGAMRLCSPLEEKPGKCSHDPDIFQYLTVGECMELANIEHGRQAVIQIWRYIENQKRTYIELAMKRKSQKEQ